MKDHEVEALRKTHGDIKVLRQKITQPGSQGRGVFAGACVWGGMR